MIEEIVFTAYPVTAMARARDFYERQLGLQVDDSGKTLAHLKPAGVPLKMNAYESPVCWMAIVNDPDGNSVCVHQRKFPSAPAATP